jgi:hypothetical protein
MSTTMDSNGYVEPPRDTGNRMNTDYAEDVKEDDNRYKTFRDRRKKKAK